MQLDFGFRAPVRRRKKRRGRPVVAGSGVPHLRRKVCARQPLHVTMRLLPHVWQLRSRRCYTVLQRAFVRACARFETRIAHFSVQRDHVHIIVETRDAEALGKAMQGLAIRLAKGLNRLMSRRGRVFGDRYHARSLRTPSEIRRCLVYVYGNARKHLTKYGHTFADGFVDPYSSAAWFDGWARRPARPDGEPPVAPAATWLLTTGWRERAGGPLRGDEVPAS